MEHGKNTKEYLAIDIPHFLKSMHKRLPIILLIGLAASLIGFSIATFFITPAYASSVLLYINNSAASGTPSGSISSSDISASQSLVSTYSVLLNNRTTLNAVIEETGITYSWQTLSTMIRATPVNGTEVMRVTVTSENPYEAEKIANGVAQVLIRRVEEVAPESSMSVVDTATVSETPVGPDVSNYMLNGLLVGLALSTLLFGSLALLDNTIHDEEYVIEHYNYPILAKIPDLMEPGAKRTGYYSQGRPTK